MLLVTEEEIRAKPGAQQKEAGSATHSAAKFAMVSTSRATQPAHDIEYPLMIISILPSIGELHHHHQPVIAYNENYVHQREAIGLLYPSAFRKTRSRSVEQPARSVRDISRARPSVRLPRTKAPPPCPFGAGPPCPIVYPPTLRNAIYTYDVARYWRKPTVTVRMALSGDTVCTLGPEFAMLGVRHYGTVSEAERYVSAHQHRSLRIVYIGKTRAPHGNQNIAEILLKEHTDTIFVQPVPAELPLFV